ncbi:MAG: 2-C-methyl-D-erythritol 2,4-cyclodiphosphate synthase [Bacilli bacterium]
MRVGLGFDVHRFVSGRPLILGGVEIPHDRGLEGHSDADVLIHALMDALLGAAALGDIGDHFPDADPKYEGISSVGLLGCVCRLLADRGYRVINVDIMVLAEQPKLARFKSDMIHLLARELRVAEADVSIKATTMERMGFVGREEGIAAQAVALIDNGGRDG